MRHILIFLAVFLLSFPVFGQSEETCYVDADATKSEFDPTLLSNISISLISEFLKEVEPIPPAGLPMDACVYLIGAVKVKETIFVTFKGKNLNSFGNSKLPGPDGFQESVLKALYRALEDKRKLICDAYGEYIEKCGGSVKKIPADKMVKIIEMRNDHDHLGKRISVLDTRIEKLNSGTLKVLTNPHSFGLEIEEFQNTKGFYVAVGEWGYSLTSSNGNFWVFRNTKTKKDLFGVTYGNGLFVAVGNETILISPDGNTWAERISSGNFQGVTYRNGTFIAVGSSIFSSRDGITWTKRSSKGQGGMDVTYGNGLFVVVGRNGAIFTSPNGESWTRVNYKTSNLLRGITYGNGLFVAVGTGGIILTSSDGESWTRTNNEGIDLGLYSVTYGNGLFVAVGEKEIRTSFDGYKWTKRTYETGVYRKSDPLVDVIFANGIFTASGFYEVILSSRDGITWTKKNSGERRSSILYGVTYSK